jgi:hypothetical protein
MPWAGADRPRHRYYDTARMPLWVAEKLHPEELMMSDPTIPAPDAVHRGAVQLSTALRLSTLLPPEQDAIFSILAVLNAAEKRLGMGPSSSAYQASLLASVVDTYRRALAELGRRR